MCTNQEDENRFSDMCLLTHHIPYKIQTCVLYVYVVSTYNYTLCWLLRPSWLIYLWLWSCFLNHCNLAKQKKMINCLTAVKTLNPSYRVYSMYQLQVAVLKCQQYQCNLYDIYKEYTVGKQNRYV